jgi:hypothetical protein
MKYHSHLPPVEWVHRVNNTWIVRAGLEERAREWLDYLNGLNDGRLLPSCKAARAMCGLREPLDDPKPWFYAGLFSLATSEEAVRYLQHYRITMAALPAMADDEKVALWLDRVGDETRDLVLRLRENLPRAGSSAA